MRSPVLLVVVLALLLAPQRPLLAQQADGAASLPPSSLELRLREHEVRQQQVAAARKARQESRYRRLTGTGTPAGAYEVAPVQTAPVNEGSAIKLAVLGLIALAAVTAWQAGNELSPNSP